MVWWKCLKCTHKKPLHSMDCGMQQWPVVPVKHNFLHEFTAHDPQPNQSISVSYYETSSSAVFVNISSALIGRLIGSSEIPTIQSLLIFRNNSQPFSSFKIQDQCKKPDWKKTSFRNDPMTITFKTAALPCSHRTWVAGPYPFSLRAAMRNMIAGFVV